MRRRNDEAAPTPLPARFTCEGRGAHPSYNSAKRALEFTVAILRAELRPRYGSGFAGAPIAQRQLPGAESTSKEE